MSQTLIIIILLVAAASFSIQNPDFLARETTVRVLLRTYTGPVGAGLVIIAGGSWILLWMLSGLSQWVWRRRARKMQSELDTARAEIQRLKASAFDSRPAAMPSAASPASASAPPSPAG